MDAAKDGFYINAWFRGVPDVRCWIRRADVSFVCETLSTGATVIGLSTGRSFKVKMSFDEVHELVFNGKVYES